MTIEIVDLPSYKIKNDGSFQFVMFVNVYQAGYIQYNHGTSNLNGYWGVSENVVYPIYPMVLLIIIPFLNG